MSNVNIHIDSSNVDSFALVNKNVPKDEQKTGKRLPFFYFWLKDHFFQTSDNFCSTSWSFCDEPEPISQNLEQQKKISKQVPDIIGLGIYLWNREVALENAKWYKKKNPNALVVAGGPSAEASKDFLEANPSIDMVILGPGIEIFKRVIDAYIENKPVYQVEGVSYLKEGKVIKNKSLPRRHDPLLINFVENFESEVTQLIEEYQKKYKIVIFQSYYMHGCPYSCSFCEQGTALWTKINKRSLDLVYKEIDYLSRFENVQIEWLDQNFGITKEYIDIVKYFLKANEKQRLLIKYPTMAKNNIDVVFEIVELLHNSGTKTGIPNFAYIALQDTNPDVLKLNGRPVSKEYEKIEKFKEITKNQKYKHNQVDIILGLPGQSFETLSVTLYDLFKNELLGQKPPLFYNVLPNTTLTSPDNTIYFETNDVWHRERKRIGTNFMDFDDNPYSSHQYYLKYLTKSATIDTEELMSAQYMFVLLSHVGALIRWLDTPLIYLENYHSKTKKDFIKSFTHFFKPVNRHLLPECVIKDIDHLCRWFSGKDKFFSRRDNHDKGFLVFDTMPKYRFHFDYDAMSQLFHDIFIKVIGRDTDLLRGIMKWQKFVTFFPGKKQLDLISYNYDDVAQKKSESFYLSKWTVDFDTLELSEVHDKFRKMQDVHFIPNLLWEEIDTSLQIPLNLKDEQFQFKNSVKTINHARI